MQVSVHQEENREADKLRRFRIYGNVSKQAGMSSGAPNKNNFSISENILWKEGDCPEKLGSVRW